MGPTEVGESEDVTAMVKTALDMGYRHIDTVDDGSVLERHSRELMLRHVASGCQLRYVKEWNVQYIEPKLTIVLPQGTNYLSAGPSRKPQCPVAKSF